MHPILLGLLAAAPLLLIAAVSRKRQEKAARAASGEQSGEAKGNPILDSTPNDRFFEQVTDRSNVIPFVRAYGQSDKYMIQSLLDAHGIPSFLSSQYVNNLLPGVRVKNHTDSIIYIDAKDKVEAAILILEYFESLLPGRIPEEYSVAKSLYNAIAFLHAVPAANENYRPELLIDIDELVAKLEEKARE
jgi:hypothetical protein